jgi:hypothetical protein
VRRVPLLLLAVALWSMPLHAQAPAQRVKLVSLTFDHWRGSVSGAWPLRPTLRLTMYSPRRPGLELAAVIFPDGISVYPPAVLLDLQAGLVHPVAAGPVTFLPRVGPAALTAIGLRYDTDPIRLAPGIQAGLGILIPVDRKSDLRLDVTRHVYDSSYERLGVWSFGFGVSGGLRRPR